VKTTTNIDEARQSTRARGNEGDKASPYFGGPSSAKRKSEQLNKTKIKPNTINHRIMYVYASMVADLIHFGHVAFLERVYQIGLDKGLKVLVGLHNDEDVASYKRKPILKMEERKSVVEAIRYVDKVIVNAPLVLTDQFMKDNRIELVVHAHDPSDNSNDREYAAAISANKFERLEYTKGISTTEIIARCAGVEE